MSEEKEEGRKMFQTLDVVGRAGLFRFYYFFPSQIFPHIPENDSHNLFYFLLHRSETCLLKLHAPRHLYDNPNPLPVKEK